MKETNNIMIFNNQGVDKQVKVYLQEDGGFSSRLLRFVKKEGTLYTNGKQARLDQVFRYGEVLEVRMPEEAVDVEGEDKPLDILYEDLDILVVSKESNMVTHPTKGHPDNNLANRVAFHFIKSGIAAKVRFVNRLDRDTTGVVVIAKSKFAHQHIQNQMQEKKVEKVYYALVEGKVQPSTGAVDLPIGRPSDDSIIRTVMETGKSSMTHYETLHGDHKATLLRLYLETGRTHQIRVHMKAIGHPLIGDTLYNPEGTTYGMERQALHGGEIHLTQPRTGKPLVVRAFLPVDMIACMDRLGWPDLMETGRIL